jgi:hypothetical protein
VGADVRVGLEILDASADQVDALGGVPSGPPRPP